MVAIVGAPAEEAWEMALMGFTLRMPWVCFGSDSLDSSSLSEWGGVMVPVGGRVAVCDEMEVILFNQPCALGRNTCEMERFATIYEND